MEAGCALARMGGAGGVIMLLYLGVLQVVKKLQLPNLLELVKPHKTFRCD